MSEVRVKRIKQKVIGGVTQPLKIGGTLDDGSDAKLVIETDGTLKDVSGNMIAGIVTGTAVTASGAFVDFTGIPSWVKKITVMLAGVSSNGTSPFLFQLGTGAGIESTGYAGNGGYVTSSGATQISAYTNGFGLVSLSAANSQSGTLTLYRLNGNTFVCSGSFAQDGSTTSSFTNGSKTLANPLSRIRITTVNGTDAFDAGTINIMYEG